MLFLSDFDPEKRISNLETSGVDKLDDLEKAFFFSALYKTILNSS